MFKSMVFCVPLLMLLYESCNMVKKIFLSVFTIISVYAQDPFTFVLMVKDEESMICKTVEPYVQEGISSFFIFDTGSTDKTIEVVQDYFQKHNVTNAHIFQEPFVDFSTSRNRALDVADQTFPDTPFLLMP